MASSLSAIPAEIVAYPYAVKIERGERITVFHFDSKAAADLMAHLMDGGGNRVTRHVANTDTFEWHEVTYFIL